MTCFSSDSPSIEDWWREASVGFDARALQKGKQNAPLDAAARATAVTAGGGPRIACLVPGDQDESNRASEAQVTTFHIGITDCSTD
jgi:hypothetical protein